MIDLPTHRVVIMSAMTIDSTAAADRVATGSERLWATTVGGDLSFLLARANAVSLASVTGALAELGLKVRSYSVLAVAANGVRPSQRELSEFLRLDPSQIVALVDDLEARKLVRRVTDPSDRRSKVVVVTAEGLRTFERAREVAIDAEHDLFEGFTADEREQLRDLLRTLAAER